jgi:hypothetical protein
MKRHWLAVLALIAALWLIAPSLGAESAQGKGKGNPHANERADENRGRDDRDEGWERRDGYEYRIFGERDDRPPGWSKGKKTGWGNCGLPPGQAKKYGCRTYTYQGRPHYYYRDDQGRIIVRRPEIHGHGGADVH